jgi:cell division protein FtsI (penicillin-binding protein 3)
MALSVSLMQLAQSYTVFARDGDMVPLSLTMPEEGAPLEPQVRQQVVSAQTAKAVRRMLRDGHAARRHGAEGGGAGLFGGGKTGTSRKWVDKELRRYANDRHRGWFVGMAPADKPRIVVAVMIDEPKAGKFFGGDVAAPVFSQVVQQTLRTMGVPPDLDVKTQIVARDIPVVEESY